MREFQPFKRSAARGESSAPFFLAAVAGVPSGEGAWGAEALSPALFAAALGLGLLTVVSLLFARRSRNQLRRISQTCDALQPELEKTRSELDRMTRRFAGALEQHGRLLEESGAAIFKLDKRGECIYVNQALERLIGFSKQFVLENGLLAVVHSDDQGAVQRAWRGFAAQIESVEESTYRLQHNDGRVLHVMARGSIIRDADQSVAGYLGLWVDVSALHEQAHQAQVSTRCSRRFMEQTVSGFYELSPAHPIALTPSSERLANQIYQQMRLIACNDGLAQFCGQRSEALVGTALKDLPAGCGWFDNIDCVRRFVEDGLCVLSAERVCSDHRGTPRYLRNDVVGMVDAGHLIRIWGAQYDISAQKREQEHFEQQLAFYRRILDALPGEVFVKDPRCRYLYVSRAIEARTAVPVEDWIDKTVFEVLPAVARDYNSASIEAMKRGAPCRRIDSHPDGDRWMETIEKPLVSEDGVVEGVVGISIDITERTRREQALQRSEHQFRALVEQSPVGLVLAERASRKIAYANPAFCELFGYAEDEVSALTVGVLHSAGSRREVLAQWDERAQASQRFDQALSCLRKDRSLVYAEVGVAPAQVNGVEQTIGVYCDAAGRKRQESEWMQQRDRLAALVRDSSLLILTVDSGGIIRSANDALLEKMELDEPDLVGHPFVETLVCNEDCAQFDGAFCGDRSQLPQAYEYRLNAGDGAPCTLLSRVVPQGDEGEFAVIGIDVTAQRILEQQLRTQVAALADQLDERDRQLAAARTARQELAQQCEARRAELRELQSDCAQKVEQLDADLTALRQREAELEARGGELIDQQLTLEAALLGAQDELAQEQARARQLTAEFEAAQSELVTVRHWFEARIEQLEAELENRRACEVALSAECERLSRQLIAAQAEASANQQVLAAQTEQKVAAMQQTVDELTEREQQLRSAGSGSERRIEELESALRSRTSELEGAQAACRDLEKSVADLRGQMEASVDQERVRQTEHVDQLQAELASSRDAEWALREHAMVLQQRQEQLEAIAEQRVAELARAAEQRVALEDQLQALREDTARACEIVAAQTDQKLCDLTAQLESRQAGEEQLLAEKEALRAQLAQAQQALSERSNEVMELTNTRAELEGIIALEKENLAHRIQLSKEEVQESHRVQAHCQEREEDLMESMQDLQNRLARQERALARDAEQRRSAEQEADRLRALLDADGRKLLDWSSDLQSPLTPLVELSAAVLEEADVPRSAQRQLKRIHRCGQRLQALVGYQQELFRMEHGGVNAVCEAVDLNAFLMAITDEFTEASHRHRLFFALSRSDNLPARAWVAPAGIRRVIDSLLRYALKKTASKGRIGVHVTREQVDAACEQMVFLLVFSSLEDDALITGGVLRPEGEPRAGREMSNDELELALTRRYAELLGGSLALQGPSELTQRLRFSVPLEVSLDAEDDAGASECARAPTPSETV